MSVSRSHKRLAVAVPVVAGVGLLAGGLLLLPDRREVDQAQQRAFPAPAPAPAPVAATPTTEPLPTPSPTPSPPAQPSLAAAIPTADAATLAALTARLQAAGERVTTAQVAYDLVAKGRPAVALAYLAARPDGGAPATWRLRIDLLDKAGRTPEAIAQLAAAAPTRTAVPPADLIAAAYALGRPDLIIQAAASGAIPPPDRALALDLARRADAGGHDDWIATLDQVTRADWRAADPWLAYRIATRRHDSAAALRAADRLPPDQREAARETVLTKSGDRAGLRRLLLARSEAPGADPSAIAEQLLAIDAREDAVALLRRAATGRSPADPATRRLLYLLGPRPAATDIAWLRQQTTRGGPADQFAWLQVYASRDRPREALAFLATHPLAARTDVMLTRLSLARSAGDEAASRRLTTTLLDGRPLDPAQLRTIAAAQPPGDAATAATLARRRIASGAADPRDAIDLAWSSWNAGDAAGTIRWLRDHLAAHPDDPVALRLMADAQAKTGGAAAARPWLERALAQTPADTRARAELLDRLGRRAEAIALVDRLRAAAPGDRALAAFYARLLIANGQPARARAALAP